ncbi:MAG: terminase family protein [Clostridia bacterium]|nr:terminase family protein [Clostridia bacterium]
MSKRIGTQGCEGGKVAGGDCVNKITSRGGYVFGARHREYMRQAYRSTVNVAEGAVRAGKTIDNVFVFAALLERSPDKLHLASGSTLGNAKLNIGECNGLGLEHIFEGRCAWTKYRGNDALRVQTAVGERIIIFSGGKNADSFKRIRGNSYGMWIATEINLHSDSFIKEAFNRQLAARDRRIFWDLNPSSPNHFIYSDYIDRFADVGEPEYYNYAHFTIRDNPVISPERLREITAQYDPGSVWYRRDILGERCAAEGLIYRRFADDPASFTIDDVPVADIEFVTVGIDFGGNRSRTTFVATALLRGEGGRYGGVAVIGEHAISGGKGEIDSGRINGEFSAFIRRIRQRWQGVYIKYIFADCEAQYLINGLRRHLARDAELGSITVMDSAKRPISDRIAFVVSLMSAGKFFLLRDCVLLRDGLSGAVWDEKSEGDKRLDNFTSDIDILDAMEYSIERYMGKIN